MKDGWFSSSAQRNTRSSSMTVRQTRSGSRLDPGVGLLVDEDAVAYQPQHDAAVKLEIFRIVRPVPLSLKLGLFGQVLCLG